MKEKFSLKDALFNKERVVYLAGLFSSVDKTFKSKPFISEVVAKFPELELKARIVWIAEVLERYLPNDPKDAMKMIVAALPPPLDPTKTDDDFGQFILAPLGEYVVRNGLTKTHLKQSLTTLREITMRFSMEDAIRSFLNTFPVETLAAYDKWVGDKNYHVRRLVSESSRPMLPWSRRLTMNYAVPMKYLDILYADKTRYVTRSVANHLNDISKKDPALVVVTLQRWQKEGRQTENELAWMTRHALRTLLKQGNVDALALLGYHQINPVAIKKFNICHTGSILKLGDILMLECSVVARDNCAVMVDYAIHFRKANGQTKPKVFKWKKLQLKGGEVVVLTKRHLFKSDAMTFKLYPGEHQVSVQINGQASKAISFQLA